MDSRFGKLINDGRRAKRITLRKLGQLVGVSPSYLSEIENGIKQPPKDKTTIENLSLVLNIALDKLIKAATADRAVGKATGFMSSIFGENNDLAYSLYRATENHPEEKLQELREKLKKTIVEWEVNIDRDK
jgi:transcriptional regulator with XRE-family HTH domain